MKTEEYKQIEQLVERFFEGQTSKEEERILYEFFARGDVPAGLESYKEVFRYFGKGIIEEFREVPELCIPWTTRTLNKRKAGWILALSVIAASLALFFMNRFFSDKDVPFNPYEGSYIVRNGLVISDLGEIQPELERICQKVEAEQGMADRMLIEAEKLERISGMANQALTRSYSLLLDGIVDDRIKAEVDSMLRELK